MATIRDVAKLAGVSVATVSRVLNKKGYVHEETVRQVEKAIEQLQYRPNAVAKSLFKKSSTMIAFLVTDFQQPSFLPLLTAIEQAACGAGYQTLVCNLNHDSSYIDTLLQNNTAGYILSQQAYDAYGARLGGAPLVVLEGAAALSVCGNAYDQAKRAVAWLQQQGAHFLAYAAASSEVETKGYEGFEDTALVHNMPYRFVPAGAEAVQVLQSAPYIDGIVAENEEAAIGIQRALQEEERKHVHVISLEQSRLYPAMAPSYEEQGKAAVHLLTARIQCGQPLQKLHRVPTAFIHG